MELERGAVARHRLDVLGLQLLVDAGVSVLSHAPAVPLERGFLMSAVTPAGPFYFKFFPNPVVADLRSEAAVLATLEDEVDWVPRLYKFGPERFFVSDSWPRLGMGIVGTSEIVGAVFEPVDEALLGTVIDRVAEMHAILAKHDRVHTDVDLRTDYQQLVQLYLDCRELLHQRRMARSVEKILDRGIVERPLLPIHSDLRYENLIVQSGAFRGIIDFSDARRSVREDELGRLWQYVIYTHGTAPSALQGLLAAYETGARYSLNLENLALSIAYNTLFRYVHDRPGSGDASRLDDLVDRILRQAARGAVTDLW